jgi:glutathione S-transferase
MQEAGTQPAPPPWAALATPVLYSFRRCPYAMRARLALQAAGVKVEWREILLRDKPAALLQASPKGTVPVLVLPGGGVIEQSLEIMRWALQQNDPQAWLPKDAVTLEDARDCVAINDGPFKQALDRYKYPARFGLADGLQARAAGTALLGDWERRLQQQAFLGGAHWGFLDAAIAPFVRQFAHTDKLWFAAQDWPRLQHWLATFEASPSFAAVMEKVPVWQAGDAPRLSCFAP